jgi:hypothetical protein
MAAPPPDDPSAEAQADSKMPTELFGWYVVCNDRVVLAGDKTARTVWGVGGFNNWHFQYNGFLGIASFRSENAALLPWTTTKRGIDLSNPLYRRAVVRMKQFTKDYIDYTEERKDDLKNAKELESRAASKSIADVAMRDRLIVPRLQPTKVTMATIQYRRPRAEVLKVAEALGNRNMNYKDVGVKTFEYFKKREVEED